MIFKAHLAAAEKQNKKNPPGVQSLAVVDDAGTSWEKANDPEKDGGGDGEGGGGGRQADRESYLKKRETVREGHRATG